MLFLVHFSSLIPKILVFTLAISCLTTLNLPWFMDLTLQVPILLFTASNLASITSPIHNWVLFFLWLHAFILSGVISPLITSSILGTYRPGEFIFQCAIFLPFHLLYTKQGFPGGLVVKNPPANAGDGYFIPGSGRFQRRKWQPTPVFLSGKSPV